MAWVPITLTGEKLFPFLPGGEAGLVPRASPQPPSLAKRDAPPTSRDESPPRRRDAPRDPPGREERPASTHVEPASLAPEQLKARLQELQGAVSQAKDVMDSVYEDTQLLHPKLGRPSPGPETVKRWKAAVSTWQSLRDETAQVEDELRKVGFHPLPAIMLGRRNKLVAELTEQYGDHGPQYRMLVEMAASKKLRLEMLERSGTFGSEYEAVARGLRDDIAQLQRYTEATKSEAIHKEVNEVGSIILGIAERHLHDQPGLFKRIVSDVVRAIEGGGGAGLVGARPLPMPALLEGEKTG